jgi:protein SCO1/2
MTQSRLFSTTLATLAALVLLFSIGALMMPKAPRSDETGTTVIKPPNTLDSFELRDQKNGVFNPARFAGHWSFVFFGYTRCPDVCPTALATLRQVHELAGGLDKKIQYVFVSVDPQRDTREILEKYTAYFNPEFLGVSGTPAELEKLAKTLGVYYRRTPTAPDGTYEVDHSAAIFLVDPESRLHAVYSAPQDAQRLADSLRRLQGG